MNAQDDDGVLVGNWSGNYEGGKRPTSWISSLDILKSYYSSVEQTGKPSPVKFGQCWVYSAVATTGKQWHTLISKLMSLQITIQFNFIVHFSQHHVTFLNPFQCSCSCSRITHSIRNQLQFCSRHRWLCHH